MAKGSSHAQAFVSYLTMRLLSTPRNYHYLAAYAMLSRCEDDRHARATSFVSPCDF